MFDFDTILYFVLGVILVLIILHNLSMIFHGRVRENMKEDMVNDIDDDDIGEDAIDDDAIDEDDDDDEGPIPNYSVPVDENTIDSMVIELDKEVILEPSEMETIDDEK